MSLDNRARLPTVLCVCLPVAGAGASTKPHNMSLQLGSAATPVVASNAGRSRYIGDLGAGQQLLESLLTFSPMGDPRSPGSSSGKGGVTWTGDSTSGLRMSVPSGGWSASVTQTQSLAYPQAVRMLVKCRCAAKLDSAAGTAGEPIPAGGTADRPCM